MSETRSRGLWKHAGLRWALAGGATIALAFGPGALALACSTGLSSGGTGGSTSVSGSIDFTRFVTENYPCAGADESGAIPTNTAPYCGLANPYDVGSFSWQYKNGTLSISTPQDIATVPAADGIQAISGGNLLIGGQNLLAENSAGPDADVYVVDPSTGDYISLDAGTTQAYMLGLSPNGTTAYVGGVGDWTEGAIGVIDLTTNPPTLEGTITVSGPDQNVDQIAFIGNQAYYTSSLPNGYGDFGKINLATGVEDQMLADQPGIHGLVYDSYTGDIFTAGDGPLATSGPYKGDDQGEILQINPVTGAIIGSQVVNLAATDSSVANSYPGVDSGYFDVFDTPWTDGQGQVFASSNDGQLTMVDYSRTGNLNNPSVVQTVPVVSWLDDIIGSTSSSTTPSCGQTCVSCGTVQNGQQNTSFQQLSYGNDDNCGQQPGCNNQSNNQNNQGTCGQQPPCNSQNSQQNNQNNPCCGQQGGTPVSSGGPGGKNPCYQVLSFCGKACGKFCSSICGLF